MSRAKSGNASNSSRRKLSKQRREDKATAKIGKEAVREVHLGKNVLLTTLSRYMIGIAVFHAHRLLDDSRELNKSRLGYQKAILEANGGGELNPKYKPGMGRPGTLEMGRKYTEYNGLPCFDCRLLIPLSVRLVRRRAGNASKYYHCSCWERITNSRLPAVADAELDAMRLGIYPIMQYRGTQ